MRERADVDVAAALRVSIAPSASMLEVRTPIVGGVDQGGDAVKSPLEKVIETEIRVALNQAHVQVWKHRIELCPQCGAKPKKGQGLGIGASDLLCVVPPTGRVLALECKRPETRSRTTEDQDRWLEQVRKYGGVAGVVTSVEEAFRLLDLARKASL
jgi:hypothetical protein